MKMLLSMLAFAILASPAHAQPCVSLSLMGATFPDHMPLTNPITKVQFPVQITNNCSQTAYYGKSTWSGLESADDTWWSPNGCTTLLPAAVCYGYVGAAADPDDPMICQPPNAPSENWCVDTLTTVWCFSKPCPGSAGPTATLTFQWTVDNPKVEGDVEPASLTFSGPIGVRTADQTITGSNSETCGTDCTGLVTFGQVTVPPNVFIDQDNCSDQSIPQSQTCTVTVYAIPVTTAHTSPGPIDIPNNLGNNGRSKVYTTIN